MAGSCLAIELLSELTPTPQADRLMRILERYVLAELLRVFLLLLTGLTVLLVIVGVVEQARKYGLGLAQIRDILPYIVPSLLPFTIPATLLLSVCVVYGRMSGDQEITAAKAAGISVWTLLLPSLVLGGVLSLCTFWLTDQFIPWSVMNIERIVMMAMEDIFLDQLRTKNQVNDTVHGIAITVIRVDGKTLITPTFRYTSVSGQKVTIQAQEATVKFDMAKKQVLLQLYRAHIETSGSSTIWVEREERAFPLPSSEEAPRPRNIPIKLLDEEMESVGRQRDDLIHREITTSAFALTQGEFDRLGDPNFQNYEPRRQHLNERFNRLKTEKHSRVALACGCFFFVWLGSPFSILQQRRQFLTNFILCFVPVLIVYYPVVLLTMDLGKNAVVNPLWGLWIGNGLLFLSGWWVLRKVLQH